jgi:hypothetical protein
MTTGGHAESSADGNGYKDLTTPLIEEVTATMAGEGGSSATISSPDGELEATDADDSSAETDRWRGEPFLRVELTTGETGARVPSRLTLSPVRGDVALGRPLIVNHALDALAKSKLATIEDLKYVHLLDFIFIPDLEDDDESMRQRVWRENKEIRLYLGVLKKLTTSTEPVIVEGPKTPLIYSGIMEGIGLLADQAAAESQGEHTKDEILDALLTGIEYSE